MTLNPFVSNKEESFNLQMCRNQFEMLFMLVQRCSWWFINDWWISKVKVCLQFHKTFRPITLANLSRLECIKYAGLQSSIFRYNGISSFIHSFIHRRSNKFRVNARNPFCRTLTLNNSTQIGSSATAVLNSVYE